MVDKARKVVMAVVVPGPRVADLKPKSEAERGCD